MLDCNRHLGGWHMPTIAHCRKRAHELTALAEREPQHKAQHLNDAEAWLILAARLEDQALVAIKTMATLTA
jgi:hypothetical protein